MKPRGAHAAALSLLFVAALVFDGAANAQKAIPNPTPMPVAPLPVAPPSTTPPTNSVAGIAAGAPMSVVDAKCKEPGVKCTRRVRKTSGQVLDRVRILLPQASSPTFSKVQVTAKGGSVFSVRGTYRAHDKDRHKSLITQMGSRGTQRRGGLSWVSPTGVVTSAGMSGRSIQYIDTKAANAQGINITPQAFIAPAPPVPLAPVDTPARAAPLRLADLPLSYTASPVVTKTLLIPVKIVLLKLKCVVENDLTSIVYGDDPYLHIVGVHTTFFGDTKAWYQKKTWGDIEEDDHMDINVTVFDTTDARRRRLGYGEAVGVQLSLSESDVAVDDEIDFKFPIIDYGWAESHQGSNEEMKSHFIGDSADYEITYRLEIGTGTPDASNGLTALPLYRPLADPKRFAGTFSGFIGDQPSEATLSFVASRDPAFPAGAVYGSIKDGPAMASVRTKRLEGSSIELSLKYASGSAAELNGYLIGEGAEQKIAGTITRDGVQRGIVLGRR